MYEYKNHRAHVFTEEGQVMFLKVRDTAFRLMKIAGAASCENLIANLTGSTWDMLACVDRLVELKEIREITQDDVAGQHRVYVRAR